MPRAPIESDPIADLRAQIADLAARVEALERPRRPAVDDAGFVLALARATAGRVFTSHELHAHSCVDPALGAVLGGMSARRIGKRLRSVADRPVGGVVLAKVGRDGQGTLWHVQVVDQHAASGMVRGAV